MRRAVDIFEKNYRKEQPHVATAHNNLAQLLKATNRLAEAESVMRRVVEIFEACFGKEHPNVAIALNNLARLLEDSNRLAEAEPKMRRMVLILLRFTIQTGYSHSHLRDALNNYLSLLHDWKGTEAMRDGILSLGPEAGMEEAQFQEILAQAFGA